MVEYDAPVGPVGLVSREHEPAFTTQQKTVHLGSHFGGALEARVTDWDTESTGQMILAWGEAARDSSINVSFPRSEPRPSDHFESDFFDWSLFGEDDLTGVMGMDLGSTTELVLPRPRSGEAHEKS